MFQSMIAVLTMLMKWHALTAAPQASRFTIISTGRRSRFVRPLFALWPALSKTFVGIGFTHPSQQQQNITRLKKS
jgi:hypothetical protein